MSNEVNGAKEATSTFTALIQAKDHREKCEDERNVKAAARMLAKLPKARKAQNLDNLDEIQLMIESLLIIRFYPHPNNIWENILIIF